MDGGSEKYDRAIGKFTTGGNFRKVQALGVVIISLIKNRVAKSLRHVVASRKWKQQKIIIGEHGVYVPFIGSRSWVLFSWSVGM